MANFEFATVTDHVFKVKDPAAFEQELIKLGVPKVDWDKYSEGLIWEGQKDGTYWMGGYNADLTIWPPDGGCEIELLPIIAKHIAKGEFAVFMSAGWEKLRYVSGWVAVVAEGTFEVESLDALEGILRDKLKKGR